MRPEYETVFSLLEVRQRLDYDPDTGTFWWRYWEPNGPSWNTRRVNTQAGTLRPEGYRAILLDGFGILEHRLAWFHMTGAWPIGEIDHRDRVRDNNRWLNLRDVTKTENQRNKSGHPGIRWHKGKQRWTADLRKAGKLHWLGQFDNFDEALAARKHGEALHWN